MSERDVAMFSAFKDPRKATYLNPEGADKPLRSPLPLSKLAAARACRTSGTTAAVTPVG